MNNLNITLGVILAGVELQKPSWHLDICGTLYIAVFMSS